MPTTKPYDLAVAYRIYPGISQNPLVFADNKFLLAKLCTESFKASLGSVRAKIWIVLDNCPKEYETLFTTLFEMDDLEFIRLNGEGNAATFMRQIKILTEQDDAEIVFFAEDDYFYLPNQFEQMINFIRGQRDVDFVSPYDHPDNYITDLGGNKNWIRFYGNRHWRTSGSTCLTFLTTRTTLKKTAKVFETFARRNSDCSIWLSLTKDRVFNAYKILQYFSTDRLAFKFIAKAWFFCWNQILFGKRRSIWIPIPTAATHLESTCLSPGIDWLEKIRESQAVSTTN